jgi:MarR family transcriptional regulator, organic hydroperoxide resistance regulator
MEFVKVARAIGVLNRTFQRYISDSLSEKDLSYSDSIFLVNIGDRSGTSQEELADLLAIDKAAITRSVKSLEEKGYIRTERSKADKRAKELYLTPTGESLFGYMQTLHQQWISHVLDGMDPNDLEAFTKGIDLMSLRARAFNK